MAGKFSAGRKNVQQIPSHQIPKKFDLVDDVDATNYLTKLNSELGASIKDELVDENYSSLTTENHCLPGKTSEDERPSNVFVNHDDDQATTHDESNIKQPAVNANNNGSKFSRIKEAWITPSKSSVAEVRRHDQSGFVPSIDFRDEKGFQMSNNASKDDSSVSRSVSSGEHREINNDSGITEQENTHLHNQEQGTKDDSIINDLESESTFPRPTNIMKPKYILLPHSDFRSSWDIFMSFVLMYVAAFVPYRMSYLGELNRVLTYVEASIDVLFGIDIVLNFFTAYEIIELQRYEYNLFKIWKRYLKGSFFLDLIATFPFDLVIAGSTVNDNVSGLNQASKLTKLPKLIKFLRVARLLRLLRVYRLQKIIQYIELNYNVHQGISRLFNIVAVILFATHLVGCLWHAIGVDLDVDKAQESCPFEYDEEYDYIGEGFEGGWVCREGLSGVSDGYKYIASLYWAFSTLTTVGYGDISARTVAEQCFSMVMMLLGVSWYAYVVGSMSTIISSFDRQSKQMRQKMLQVNTFIQESKLPRNLGSQIRKYFEYSLSRKSNGLFGYDADQILAEMSSTLRIDVITHVEADLIKKIPFFEGKNTTFVASAIQASQPIVVHEGDFIIKEGSAADEMYFLIKGRAAVFYGQKRIKVMEEGTYFGEIGCILGGIRRAGIIAETTCELQCLSKRNLNLLLGHHPEVGEEIKRVARDRMSQVQKRNSRIAKVDADNEVKSRTNNTTKPTLTITNSKVSREVNETQRIDSDRKQKNVTSFETMQNDQNHTVTIKSKEEGGNNDDDIMRESTKEARRISLTSGLLKGGSHIKPDDKVIEELNKEVDIQPITVTNPAPLQSSNFSDKDLSTYIDERLSKVSYLTGNNKENLKLLIAEILVDITEDKMDEMCATVLKSNFILMQKAMKLRSRETDEGTE